MKIGYLTKRKDACWYYRVMLPMSHLAMAGHEVRDDVLELIQVCQKCRQGGLQERQIYDVGPWQCGVCGNPFDDNISEWHQRVIALIKWADVVVFQRATDVQHLRLMREVKDLGKPVIFEADDNYIEVPEWNTGYQYYKPRRGFIEEMLRLCTAITVTTDALKRRYLEFNSKIFILPNSLDIEMIDVSAPLPEYAIYDLRRKDKPNVSVEEFQQIRKDKKVVGWGGSPTHEKDVEIIIGPLLELIRKHPEVIVVMVGFVHRQMLEKFPPNTLFCVGLVPVMAYINLYKALAFDVGLAPVIENDFNAGKSALKVLEYQAINVLPVASNFETYKDSIGRGYLAFNNDPYKWYLSIRHALFKEDRSERIEFNRKMVEEKSDIKNNVKLWEAAYKTVLEGLK